MIEYSNALPFEEDAVIVIVPSFKPQSVGSVCVTTEITGGTLSSIVTGAVETTQVALEAFLTSGV